MGMIYDIRICSYYNPRITPIRMFVNSRRKHYTKIFKRLTNSLLTADGINKSRHLRPFLTLVKVYVTSFRKKYILTFAKLI